SPLQNNNNKKRNTTQTLEVPPEQSISQTVTPVIMNVDPTSQTKGKELETFDLSKGNSLITPTMLTKVLMQEHTFLPLDVTPSHPYIPAMSIKVTEIP
ncbi:19622_t:CDS:2, partial [Funneliformis geosporum]